MRRPWHRSTSIALVNVFAATLHDESFWARIVTVEIAGGSTTAPRFDRLIAHSVRYSGAAHAAVKASLSPSPITTVSPGNASFSGLPLAPRHSRMRSPRKGPSVILGFYRGA